MRGFGKRSQYSDAFAVQVCHGVVSTTGETEDELQGFTYLELALHVLGRLLRSDELLTFSLGFALVVFDSLDLRHTLRNGG